MAKFEMARILRGKKTAEERLSFIAGAMRLAEAGGSTQAMACLGHLADLAREHDPLKEAATNDLYPRLRLPLTLPLSYCGSSALMAAEAGGVA